MATAQRVRGRNVTASDLETFGKTAARLSETSGLSLTEACTRTLEQESLNAEQIRRAVEQCNIAAVNSKFASMKGASRIVHIDAGPADPSAVIGALNATASAPGAHYMAPEYSAPPQFGKVAAQAIKVAHDPDLPGLQQRLERAHDELVDRCTGLEYRMEMKFAELQDAAMRAHREGASLCDLAYAWSSIDPRMAKVAAAQLKAIPWGVKTAGLRVSAEHPSMERFVEFAKVATDYHAGVSARRNVEARLAEVQHFLGRRVS